MPHTTLHLTEEELAVLNWQYKLHGEFQHALFTAITLAVDDNLEKLRTVYPNEVNGFEKWKCKEDWWGKVQDKARKLGWKI